jgi:hypothetical protein
MLSFGAKAVAISRGGLARPVQISADQEFARLRMVSIFHGYRLAIKAVLNGEGLYVVGVIIRHKKVAAQGLS